MKYWYAGRPFVGEGLDNPTGAQLYWFNGRPVVPISAASSSDGGVLDTTPNATVIFTRALINRSGTQETPIFLTTPERDTLFETTEAPNYLFRSRQPNPSRTQETPIIPNISIETPVIEATQIPAYLFTVKQPQREVITFVNNRDLPPEIETPVIEATLYPSWLQWTKMTRERLVWVEQDPNFPPPSTETPLVESTLVPGWKFIARQPTRAVEGFNPFLPPILRTCEIITLFSTNYLKANPHPMMPVARITRIYKVKGLVHC